MALTQAIVDGYEVVASGVVHLTVTSFEIRYDGMPVRVSFKDDAGEVKFTVAVVDKGINLDLYNFNNPLGEGRVEPIGIATSNGRDVKLSFFVHTVDKSQNFRVLTYSILLGGVANG